ncbi:MAG: class I SAM-dependent methyltransferase [Saprospiraceae bacterium]
MLTEQHLPQPTAMRRYYRWHAAIYDATRWTFLLGRDALLRQLPISDAREQTLLEVGCGTGRNLQRLAERHPRLQLLGVDVSSDMLARANLPTRKYAQRVQLYERPYSAAALDLSQPLDFVLFSYALTMFNPGWEEAITSAWQDLPVGGRIAVVDFHRTPSRLFRWWMGKNHVRMEGHLLPYLQDQFGTEFLEMRPVFLGLWELFLFIGVKRA